MNILAQILKVFQKTTHAKRLTQAEILSRLNPWTLACSVGALNGSIYGRVGERGFITLEIWCRHVEKDDWERLTGIADQQQILEALRQFAIENQNRNMIDVLKDLEQERGLVTSVTLAPGEPATISVSPPDREAL